VGKLSRIIVMLCFGSAVVARIVVPVKEQPDVLWISFSILGLSLIGCTVFGLSRIPWLYIFSLTVTFAACFVVRVTGHFFWYDTLLAVPLLAYESTATVPNPRGPVCPANTVASLAAVVLIGPVGAALLNCYTLFCFRRGPSFTRPLVATVVCALSACLAGWTFLLFGGHQQVQQHNVWAVTWIPGLIGPLAAAAVVYVAVKSALLGCASRLAREPAAATRRILDQLRPLLTDLGCAALGLLFVVEWWALGQLLGLLMLAPLFAARRTLAKQDAQQHAYEATVSTLIQAVETKDFYTRGHCERVSRGSVMIATEIGMRAERVAAIRYAGMLHDVGKLGVPTSVLQKRSALTDEEYAALQSHPVRGLEMVKDLGFLREALGGIAHHHERLDGKGYPKGLAGDEIPEFARVLAVADAFDAMTSDRSYRGARPVSEALAELRRCAGTHFDPALVGAFVTAIERQGWTPPDAPATEKPHQ